MLLLLFVFVVVDVVRVVSRINGYQQGVFWKLRLTPAAPHHPPSLSIGPFKTDKGLKKGFSRPYGKGTGVLGLAKVWHSNEASANIL